MCKYFGHKYKKDSCVCLRCGETVHPLKHVKFCKCEWCGKIIYPYQKKHHDWDGCICRICGLKLNENNPAHDWNKCVCRKCGIIAEPCDKKHDWECGVCKNCGGEIHKNAPIINEGHVLETRGCVCARCGKTAHHWKVAESYRLQYSDTRHETLKCEVCGTEKQTSREIFL